MENQILQINELGSASKLTLSSKTGNRVEDQNHFTFYNAESDSE